MTHCKDCQLPTRHVYAQGLCGPCALHQRSVTNQTETIDNLKEFYPNGVVEHIKTNLRFATLRRTVNMPLCSY